MAWIRTQTREGLFDVREIFVKKASKDNPQTALMGIVTDYVDNLGVILGVFTDEAGALEELDCIEKWLDDGAKFVHRVSQ